MCDKLAVSHWWVTNLEIKTCVKLRLIFKTPMNSNCNTAKNRSHPESLSKANGIKYTIKVCHHRRQAVSDGDMMEGHPIQIAFYTYYYNLPVTQYTGIQVDINK